MAARAEAQMQAALLEWYAAAKRDLPWRRTSDPYAILVSELMLQQTRVEAVREHWSRFMRRFPTSAALAAATEDEVLEAWSGLGYYRRARSLHAAAKAIEEHHGGSFPRELDDALALPGVGPYTAGAVLSIAFDAPAPIVDGNVERVFARVFALGGARGSGTLSRAAWDVAREFMDHLRTADGSPREWNQALMEFGALLCTPRSPGCDECPIGGACESRGNAESIPAPAPKRDTVDVELEVYVIGRDGGEWLLCRRPAKGRMARLWEFPTVETTASGLYPNGAPEPLAEQLEPRGDRFTVRHSITHHRVVARVREAALASPLMTGDDLAWVPIDSAADLALTGMARKIVRRLVDESGAVTE